jgi:hypothetical protein
MRFAVVLCTLTLVGCAQIGKSMVIDGAAGAGAGLAACALSMLAGVLNPAFPLLVCTGVGAGTGGAAGMIVGAGSNVS